MSRLPGLRPEELTDDQRRLYDSIAGLQQGPAGGGSVAAIVDLGS